MNARRARAIRRSCRRRSQHLEGLGVSELFLAEPQQAEAILEAKDVRLKCYLLGFSNIPSDCCRRVEASLAQSENVNISEPP